MSTINLSSKPVLPPGELINSNFINLKSQISFTKARPTTPLPPLVQTYYEDGVLQVSVVIFIDSSIAINSIEVYFDDTHKQPIFYTCYNAPETEASEFNAYQVNFNVNLDKKPLTIETFVWDEDPTVSRGTITTVQPK